MIPIKQTVVQPDGTRFVVSKRGAIIISAHKAPFTGISKKRWREILKAAWMAPGRLWHEEMLPNHFTMAAYGEYKYQPRHGMKMVKGSKREERSYSGRKRLYKRHNLPLVWSGRLKKEVMRIQDIRPTSKGVTVVLHGPTYLYAYRKDLNQPDKAAELSAVSKREEQLLARELDRAINQIANQPRRRGVNIASGHRAAGMATT